MADLKSLSVAEMLAYCRNADGEGGAAPPQPTETAAAPTAVEPADKPQAAKPAASEAKPASGGMSVADMLAAARGEKTASTSSPAAGKPSAKPAAAEPAKVTPGSMSVADMLAAARGEKGAGAVSAKPKPAAKSTPKNKPAAASVAAKSAKPAKTGPMDTSSILAAARGGSAKPGPISKAEAAAKAKTPTSKEKQKPQAPPMPAKPAYAKPTATAKSKSTKDDRRTLVAVMFGSMLAVGFGAMTMTAGLSSLLMARFFFPNLLIEPPSRFKVGFPGDFSAGTVATKFKAQFGIWLVNAEYEGQQQIVALKSVCTHLGCTPNWLEAEQKFKCPCHGSGFYKEGINFEGPAPRPLERYAIQVADDGQIEVDKSKTYQEQLGQWSDGSSFVPV